jgi:hypothetical protein
MSLRDRIQRSTPARTSGPPGKGDSGWGSPEDDWLGDEGDLDWQEPGQTAGPPRAGAPTGAGGAEAAPHRGGGIPSDVVMRRRAVALGVAVLLVAGIAIAWALLRGGGSTSSTPTASATTTAPAAVTQPGAASPTPKAKNPTSTTTTPSTSTTPATPNTAPPASPVTLAAGETLSLGASGEDVTKVQNALAAAGHDPGPVDGSFGPQTQAAVQSFQQAQGITADGIVGPETVKALNTAGSP